MAVQSNKSENSNLLQIIYLAHKNEQGQTQNVLNHLQGVAQLCRKFALEFNAAEQGYMTGLLHDLGKYSQAFQKRLQGGAKVDHATAGAWECWRNGQPYAAFAIIGHHGGLPNGGSQGDNTDQNTFCGRINKAKSGKLPDYSAWQQEINMPDARLTNFQDPFTAMFFIRMLYSCLVDADFLDTEAFMNGQIRNSESETISGLEQKIQKYIKNWFSPQNSVDEARCAILTKCMEQGNSQKRGIFTLTVPTGGGKTVSSLAFALRHAKTNGMRRVIYVIPYTSIIEQNAAVFRKILGTANVLEHHSGVIYHNYDETTPANIALAQAAENWDLPIIVTTAVQFFESLYASKPSTCRKLHNIANSVIVFDEAQMLPLPYLRPCVAAIAQLVGHYQASAVFCTATQPALKPILQKFLPDNTVTELCPASMYNQKVFQRVTYKQAGKLTWSEIADQLNALPQVLCIVNSRKNALTIFQNLAEDGSFHLSTLMFPAHRQTVLAEVRRRLQYGLPCRVVATSLIEAGVDIDFPLVFREEAGLDSIIQAAGRCNREGKRSCQQSVVTIFQSEAKLPPIFEAAVAATRHTLQRFADLDSSQAISFYFKELLDLKGSSAQDKANILLNIEKEFMPFKSIDENFQLIDSPTRTIYIPLAEEADLLRSLRFGEYSQALFRKLDRYGVTVFEQHFQSLYEAGDIEIIADSFPVLTNLALYSLQTGLSLQADSGKALFI